MTTSWDCFDTLVTRRRFNPLSVFDAMGEELGLDNFTHRRKAAESRAPQTLASIYNELANDYQWDERQKEEMMQVEINAELKHCCPIVENINKVKDGDLIVSDMYLPASAIQAILQKNGMNKEVQYFVTTGGKSSGSIWSSLPPIDLHIGDNFHSDVSSAHAHGINAMHYGGAFLNDLEESLDRELSLLMRVVRLANPYERGTILFSMWEEQAQLNIPALILAALELPPSNLAFVMRDCVHLQRIHEALWGERNQSFHCSRVALKQGGKAWLDYVEQTAMERTIVDLQGTGRSIINYWQDTFGDMPSLFYITGTLRHGKLLVPCYHDAIERFNSSPLGSLLTFPERAECEFSKEVLACQQKAVDCAISHLPFFKPSRNLEALQKLVSMMPHSQTVKHNLHVDNHEKAMG